MIIEALNFSSLFIAQGERIFLFGLGGGGKSHSFQKKQRRISDRQKYKVGGGAQKKIDFQLTANELRGIHQSVAEPKRGVRLIFIVTKRNPPPLPSPLPFYVLQT